MTKIAIIGAGFSGLGTAYYLNKLLKDKSLDITLIDSGERVGGLASGFKMPEWEWPIENFIHHWFTNDKFALSIAEEINLKDKLIIKSTKSSCFYNGKMAQLDSPLSLIKFPLIPFVDRIRTGLTMAILRADKNYLRYENETSFSFIPRTMGKSSFEVIWKPLFLGKFGNDASRVNAAWFWARIHPRTKNLAYMEGGFQKFADTMAEHLKKNGTKILLDTKIKSIKKKAKQFVVTIKNRKIIFDKVVLAVPLKVALDMYDFPEDYLRKYGSLKSIGAQYFVLELKEPFLSDGTYWLNVNDSSFPFMMVAEHTNLVEKKHYNGKSMIWIGKYLDYDNPLWNLSEKDLLKLIIPYLKKINLKFNESWIVRSFFTRAKNAQPIIPVNYSSKIPKIKTPIENLYIANMNHVYPYDRGTNQALEVGKKVADLIIKEK